MSASKQAVLITHSHPDGISDAVETVAKAAANASYELVATREEVAKHASADGIVAVEQLPTDPAVCIVLGGDGSILYALRRFADTGVPVFGINFGTVGFLAAAERNELDQGLEHALSGKFEVMEMPGLEIEGIDAEGGDGPAVALNDVSLTRRPHGRVAELSCWIDQDEVGHVRCDGLVAATPAGSTGYNLANQGPILAWGVEGYVVSFIAAHTLTARALVVAPDDVLRIQNAAGREPVDVALDGDHVGELAPGEELAVRFRNGVGRLGQPTGASFYRRIREKFGMLAK